MIPYKATTAFVLFLLFSSFARANDNPVHQLRIYAIPKQNQKVFHERFRDHAHRIMKKYGFNIVAIWESETDDKLEFIYLLEWRDKKTMEESWGRFMADKEWKEIKRQTGSVHGTFVEAIEEKVLTLTDYSPMRRLLPANSTHTE